jgi:tRNA A-37 threonylcarbamoyl transferase component Bud32
MARLETNPDYQPLLAELGLTTPAAFLRLSGVIWCGHPDRHVARLVLAAAEGPIPVLLKREHRVRWRDRLANANAGFGIVSKSLHEFAVLRRLAALGIRCPEPLAAGEVRGQAFLLIREEEGAMDLRAFLQQVPTREERCDLAMRLGRMLARLHNAGVDHPDLYAKHILVTPGIAAEGVRFTLLDWQRSRWRPRLSWAERWRDLAALDATLVSDLAGVRERLVFLSSYLGACRSSYVSIPSWAKAACAIRRRSQRLLRQRRIRELHQAPLGNGSQNLIWLDGEAVCVTRQFQEEIQGALPPYLQNVYHGLSYHPSAETIDLSTGSRTGLLIRRRIRNLGQWLWSLWRRKRPVSPELRQAGTLFRLERYRVRVPRLLAVGQRQPIPGRLESFLLLELPEGAVHLGDWWAKHQSTADHRQRERVLGALARCLRSIHEADCILGDNPLLLRWQEDGQVEVLLASAEGMRPVRRINQVRRTADLRRLHDRYASLCSRRDQLRFLAHYLATSHGGRFRRTDWQSVLRSRGWLSLSPSNRQRPLERSRA